MLSKSSAHEGAHGGGPQPPIAMHCCWFSHFAIQVQHPPISQPSISKYFYLSIHDFQYVCSFIMWVWHLITKPFACKNSYIFLSVTCSLQSSHTLLLWYIGITKHLHFTLNLFRILCTCLDRAYVMVKSLYVLKISWIKSFQCTHIRRNMKSMVDIYMKFMRDI